MFVDEILIWANAPAVPLDFTDARVRVLSSRENVGCYGRYLCAEQARNRFVYVQDDDCLLANMDELAAVFRRDPTRIAHALRAGHFAERHLQVHGDCQVALVGWGAFMLRDWTSVLDRVPASLRAGVLFRREADRFFSVLLERKHRAIVGDIRLLDGHSRPGVALWVEPDHRRMAAHAVREALRLVRERRSPCSPAPWHVVVAAGGDTAALAESLESVAGTSPTTSSRSPRRAERRSTWPSARAAASWSPVCVPGTCSAPSICARRARCSPPVPTSPIPMPS